MPHPALVAWQKQRSGTVSVARDRLGRYHVVSNDAGRAELAGLLTRYARIDYLSSIEIPLANPPQAPVDTNIMAKDPVWFLRLKIAGGGANAAGVLWRLEDGTEFRFDRKELADVLRKPNRGHDEWWCDTPHSLCVW